MTNCAKRPLLALLLIFGLLLSLTACGGGDPEDDAIDQPTPRVDCVAHPEQCK